jgi:hypothetical protein
MPRLSRSTSSLLGLGIAEIVTACAGSVPDAVEIIEPWLDDPMPDDNSGI